MVQITRDKDNKNRSLLQKQFDAFVGMLLSFESLIRQKAWSSDEEHNSPAKYALFIQSEIKLFIEECSIEASNNMLSPGIFNEAKYIMVSLADELFIGLDWEGKDTWEANILESQLFNSHRAGQEIFTRIDEMVEARDISRYDLAYLYFSMLAFGFLGKYRGRKDDHIKQYLETLYVIMHGGEPSLNKSDDHIFDQAYSHTLVDYTPRKLIDYRPWYVTFFLIFMFFVLVSTIVWRKNTETTIHLVDEIIQASEGGGVNV